MYTSLKLSKLLADNGFEGESEKRWVLSKSAYDDNKPIWYLTTEKQTKLFTFYKRPRSSNYKFGKMNLIAKCDYEVISEIIYAYDILNSLCVKYAKKMFGESGYYSGNKFTGIKSMREAYDRVDEFEDGLFFKSFEEIAESIFHSIKQNKQDEAEEYIWNNCLFNPNNK